ncbi:hypothetical protein C7A11_20225 [Pseudomonas simiae]|nr:hypothetical protein C7A11_20225 [Pseudomonas simiae]TKK01151.1 hypothetical protein PflCFBP13514_23115 [Pseudomonas fluorescens]
MWERACSRRRSVSHRICRMTHCLREQARSHICSPVLLGGLILVRKPPASAPASTPGQYVGSNA